MKKILVLNAGHTEVPIIEELKKMGNYLVTTGKRADFAGHKLADQYIKEDYSDKEAILEIVKKENIEGIVSCAYDSALITSAYVSEQMGWKGHDTVKNTYLLHQKDQFKELCQKFNIRSPKSVSFTERQQAIEYTQNIEYPIIVKAVDQASGIGILRADDEKEAIKAIDNAFEKSKEKRIVVEPFIIGNQESYVAFVVNKKVVSSMTCNCYSPINPYLIQTETMPSDNFDIVTEELTNIVELLFRELDLVDGLITVQYIVKDGKPYVIETMRRCLGNRFLTPVSYVTGFPWYRAMIMAELGMDCNDIQKQKPLAKFAGHHAIMAFSNGTYEGVKIPDKIMEHVVEYDQLLEKGQKIEKYLSERIAYIYYVYDSREQLDKAAKNFNQQIIVSLSQ